MPRGVYFSTPDFIVLLLVLLLIVRPGVFFRPVDDVRALWERQHRQLNREGRAS